MYEFMVGDMMPSRTDEIVTSFSNTMSAKCRVLKGFEKADIRLELDRVATDLSAQFWIKLYRYDSK